MTAATAAWLIATAAGLIRLTAFGQAAGAAGVAPAAWPSGTAVERRPGTATLVLALHPACTCSQATLTQLDRLVADHPDAFDVVVLLASYDGLRDDILSPALTARPRLRRVADPEARLAQRFGALTSGHALLYDPQGRLRFSGGLTRGRGEAGDSAPLAFLTAWADGARPAATATFSVFGCALTSHGAAS